MPRAKRCPICLAAPDVLARVNGLIESGIKFAAIIAEVGQFDVYKISRHKNRCLAPPMAELPADGDNLGVWRQRCSDAYAMAVANSDSRSAIAACSAATRQLAALAKRQAEAKKDSDELSDNCNDWSEKQAAGFQRYVDSVVREATANSKPGDCIDDYGWVCDLTTATRLLLRQVTSNPDLLAQVQELATRQITQRSITGEANVTSPN